MSDTEDEYTLADYWSERNIASYLSSISKEGLVAAWKCPRCSLKWNEELSTVRQRRDPCPSCSRSRSVPSHRLTLEILEKEWVEGLNEMKITEASRSNKKYWWRCSLDPCGCHLYQCTLPNRILGVGCPYCSHHRPCMHNNLLVTHPHLKPYWSSENKEPMSNYLPASAYNASWYCPDCHNQWMSRIISICKKKGLICGKCATTKLLDSFQSANISRRYVDKERIVSQNVRLIRPEILRIWCPKNMTLPEYHTVRSRRIVRWRCSSCCYEWRRAIYRQIELGAICDLCQK